MTARATLTPNGIFGTPPQDRQKYDLTQSWFGVSFVENDWHTQTSALRARQAHSPLRILEVGAFEGAATTWFLDNLCAHPASSVTAVDTFAGGMEHLDKLPQLETRTPAYALDAELEARFRANAARTANPAKLRVMKMDSGEALLALRGEGAEFDLVYMDGSHVALDVLRDAVLGWALLRVGGTMLFDDYTWKGYMEDCYNPRVAIEAFLRCAAPEAESRETVSQMWVSKVRRRFAPTPNLDVDLLYR